jgi:hypothetical protein
MLYSIWEGDGITLTSGAAPPVFVDGRLQDPDAVKVCEFEADSWYEARRAMDARYGWDSPGDYDPHGEGGEINVETPQTPQ